MLLGVNREDNADFCFLMSVPVICGAALSEGIKAAVGGAGVAWLPVLFGVLAAAVSGYLAIRLFLAAMKKANYKWFSLYLIALSILLVWHGVGKMKKTRAELLEERLKNASPSEVGRLLKALLKEKKKLF